MNDIFYKVADNLKRIYSGKNLLWQLIAIGVTYLSLMSGLDWWWYANTRGDFVQGLMFPAVVFGGALPLLAPVFILILYIFWRRKEVWYAFCALTQAQLLGVLISSVYKAFTGRIPPQMWNFPLVNNSHGFQLGWLKGGVFWGWPSSHTTVAFAGAVALMSLMPDKRWPKVLCVLYAFYIGLGISTNIHWFSEFAAGAIFGSIVGLVVGKSFYTRLQREECTAELHGERKNDTIVVLPQ